VPPRRWGVGGGGGAAGGRLAGTTGRGARGRLASGVVAVGRSWRAGGRMRDAQTDGAVWDPVRARPSARWLQDGQVVRHEPVLPWVVMRSSKARCLQPRLYGRPAGTVESRSSYGDRLVTGAERQRILGGGHRGREHN